MDTNVECHRGRCQDHRNGLIWIAGDGDGFKVARLTANGVLDSNFGSGGVATGSWSATTGITIDSTGRALLAIRKTPPSGANAMSAARLSAQGTVDTAFGNNVGQIGFGGFSLSSAAGIQIDTVGNLYIGGYASKADGAQFVMAAATSSGMVGPKLTTAFPGLPWAFASRMASTNNNLQYYLAGTAAAGSAGSAHRSIAIARYSPIGIDGGFSGDGRATYDFVTANANVTGLAVDGSGRPVVAGYTSP